MKNFIFAIICIVFFSVQSSRTYAQFVQEKAIDSTRIEFEDQQMIIKVLDATTAQMTSADVVIKGLNPRKPVVLKSVSDTTLILKSYRLYTVSVVKAGYMYFAHKFWPEEKQVHEEKVKLQPLSVGLKTDIEDITFLGDETEIYFKSIPALEELVSFLQVNPNVKIKIIGHANGPNTMKRGEGFYKKASEKRAEAVRDYLIEHGIEPGRLVTAGAGNKEMRFPDPKTDWETQANRRIEIEIIGL
jgi:outer membrane protein OmpA-like peptidoglycan-associated protein